MTDNDNSNGPDNYQVGYGRPPKEHQFKPGQSGNKHGRPKRSLNVKTDLMAELGSRIRLTENGKQISLTRQQLVLKQLVTKAAKGDVRAIAAVVDLVAKTMGLDPQQSVRGHLSDDDEAILQDFLDRHSVQETNADTGQADVGNEERCAANPSAKPDETNR